MADSSPTTSSKSGDRGGRADGAPGPMKIKKLKNTPAHPRGGVIALTIVMIAGVYQMSRQSAAVKEQSKIWQLDSNFHRDIPFTTSTCDFKTWKLENAKFLPKDVPVIIDNVVDRWPAKDSWEKASFLEKYGDKYVLTGSEASIVYSGGGAASPRKIRDVVAQFDDYARSYAAADLLSNSSSPSAAAAAAASSSSSSQHLSFVFDTTVSHSMPELTEDVRTPVAFIDWDTPQREQHGLTWHMLSLGPSRSGLPFHAHGETWISVVHGAKQWLVYPPGYGPPAHVLKEHSPLLPVRSWLKRVYSSLKALPKADISMSISTSMSTSTSTGGSNSNSLHPFEDGFRPLECLQKAGQTIYLPAGWSHLTVNVGETIAYGGQSSYSAADRYSQAVDTLRWNDQHFDALRDAGLSLAHLSMEVTGQTHSQVMMSTPSEAGTSGVVRITSAKELQALLRHTEDTWVVGFGTEEGEFQRQNGDMIWSAWSNLASRLHGVANVALFVGDRKTTSGKGGSAKSTCCFDGLTKQSETNTAALDKAPLVKIYWSGLKTPAAFTAAATTTDGDEMISALSSEETWLQSLESNYDIATWPMKSVEEVSDAAISSPSSSSSSAGSTTTGGTGSLNKRPKGELFSPTKATSLGATATTDTSNTSDSSAAVAKYKSILLALAKYVKSSSVPAVGSTVATADTVVVGNNVDNINNNNNNNTEDIQLVVARPRGSITGGVGSESVRSQRHLLAATVLLRRALMINPLSLETHGLLAEALGYLGDFGRMRKAIKEAVYQFEAVGDSNSGGSSDIHNSPTSNSNSNDGNKDIPLLTQAAVFHKLGTTYLTQMLGADAVPLMHKSLKLLPTYVPAAIDLVVSQCMMQGADLATVRSALGLSDASAQGQQIAMSVLSKQVQKDLKRVIELDPAHKDIPRLKECVKDITAAAAAATSAAASK